MRNTEYQKVSKILDKEKLVDALDRQTDMISIANHSLDMHNYMKEKIATDTLIINDDVNMEVISVYKV